MFLCTRRGAQTAPSTWTEAGEGGGPPNTRDTDGDASTQRNKSITKCQVTADGRADGQVVESAEHVARTAYGGRHGRHRPATTPEAESAARETRISTMRSVGAPGWALDLGAWACLGRNYKMGYGRISHSAFGCSSVFTIQYDPMTYELCPYDCAMPAKDAILVAVGDG